MRQVSPGSILHMDPPAHAPWRQLVSRRFTPRATATFTEAVRAAARSVLDEITRGETVDFVDRVAAPFPVLVGGESARLVDGKAALTRRLPLALGLIALSTFVLLFLMAIAPVLPWRKASTELLSQRLFWPAWSAAASATGLTRGLISYSTRSARRRGGHERSNC